MVYPVPDRDALAWSSRIEHRHHCHHCQHLPHQSSEIHLYFWADDRDDGDDLRFHGWRVWVFSLPIPVNLRPDQLGWRRHSYHQHHRRRPRRHRHRHRLQHRRWHPGWGCLHWTVMLRYRRYDLLVADVSEMRQLFCFM